MTRTIALNCLVYTLKDKHVKDNLYLSIFHIWLARVIKFGGLTSSDSLKITIDARTFDYYENAKTPLTILLENLQCPFEFVLFDPPTTSLEGMMNKYIFTEYTQDVWIYSDIDILISNPFSIMVEQTQENTAYFCIEDLFSDDNHGEGYNMEADKNLPGFSAGKFVINGRLLRDSFFNIIHNSCDYSKVLRTVEQPIFNYAAYCLSRDTFSVNIDLLTKHVAFNGNTQTYSKDITIFNDMAGDVANGESHVKRIMNMISLYFIGIY
jgi:hypothetical protein